MLSHLLFWLTKLNRIGIVCNIQRENLRGNAINGSHLSISRKIAIFSNDRIAIFSGKIKIASENKLTRFQEEDTRYIDKAQQQYFR